LQRWLLMLFGWVCGLLICHRSGLCWIIHRLLPPPV
jgi:hypothetical protein